jgi:hypothetical protein
MPKDHEWNFFVQRDDQFVDPNVTIRSAEHIHYPGRDHVACQEIRAGLLERKSKYLKSYTAGWYVLSFFTLIFYSLPLIFKRHASTTPHLVIITDAIILTSFRYVLSPTHLHEFKSADKAQAPVMSLYLPEQKLGSHSNEGGSSNKFILKGRQTGTMHRGHTWVFRAESHDTMMAWYEDIKALTEKTPQERSEFVRGHSRSISQASQRSVSSDGVVNEDDDEPFSASSQVVANGAGLGGGSMSGAKQDILSKRPQPGGRFPSDLQVNAQRGLQAPLSPSSVSSGFVDTADRDAIAVATALPDAASAEAYGAGRESQLGYGSTVRTPLDDVPSRAAMVTQEAREDGVNPYTNESLQRYKSANYGNSAHLAAVPSSSMNRSMSNRGSTDSGTMLDVGGAARRPTSGISQGTRSSYSEEEWAPASMIMLNGNKQQPVNGAHDMPNGDGFVSGGRSIGENQSLDFSPPVRPTSGTVRNDSIPTISNLHMPGGFPRGTSNYDSAGR